MIANALRDKHRGQTLVHDKRRYRIRDVRHHGSYVLVAVDSPRGAKQLPLPLDTEITVEP